MAMVKAYLPIFVGLILSVIGLPSRADAADNLLDLTLFGSDEPPDTVLKVDLSPDGTLMRIAGDLETGSYRKVKRALEGAKSVRTIWLASVGGLVLEGFLIGSVVRQLKLDTYVESHCASACTMILTSGTHRAAYKRAKIGFHNSVEVDKDGQPVPAKGETPGAASADEPDFMQMAAFRQAGVDTAFIDRALATPNNSIWEPSHDELLKAHVLTRSLGDPERTAIKGFDLSWSALRGQLTANSAWALVALSEEKAFDEIVTTAWSDTVEDQDGGMTGHAERALAEWIFTKIAGAPDPVVRQFLAADALSPRPSAAADKEDRCGAHTTGGDAIARMVKDGLSKPELNLLKAAVAAQEPVSEEKESLSLRRYARFYSKMAKVLKSEGVPAKSGIKACPWNRLAFDQLRTLPESEQVPTLRALHAVERE